MNTAFARVLAVVRIFIGVGFVWLGVRLLLDHSFLYGGLLEHLTATGGPVRGYWRVLPYIERFETALAYFSAVASICAGVFYVTGTLISLTSLGAALLVLNYALASSSGNWPHFLTLLAAALALILLGRLAVGLTWGVDGWLIERFEDWLVLFPLRRRAPGAIAPQPKSRRAAASRS